MSDHYTHKLDIQAIVESVCGEKILLVSRTEGPYSGLLDFASTTPQPHEILEQTLCRAVTEETGLDVEHCKQYKTISSLFEFEDEFGKRILRHIGILYKVQTSNENISNSQALWHNKEELISRQLTPFVAMYLGK